jgi:hypothetical protein
LIDSLARDAAGGRPLAWPAALRRLRFGWHVWIAASLLLLALFIYTFRFSPDYYGDDDYLYSILFVNAAKFFQGPASWSLSGLWTYALDLVWQLFYIRHGPLPTMAYGLALLFAHVAGVHFSRDVVHFPMALMSAVSVVLFYVLLRRLTQRTVLSIAGALLLVGSPLLAMATRGLATVFGVAVVFGQVLALLALERLARTRQGHVFASLALANVVLSDSLFFLTVPALLLAYAAFKADSLRLRGLPAALWRGLADVRRPSVSVPVGALAMAMVAASAGVAAWNSLEQRQVATPCLLAEFVKYHGAVLGGTPGLARFVTYTSVAEGYAFPLLLVAVVTLRLAFVRHAGRSVSWNFAVVAGLGFGALYYGVYADGAWVRDLYQIYALIPFVLLFVLSIHQLSARFGAARLAVNGALALTLVCAGAAQAINVWRVPVNVPALVVAGDMQGISHADMGTKAAGYVARLAGEASGGSLPNSTAVIDHLWRQSTWVYGGLWADRLQPASPQPTAAETSLRAECSAISCLQLTFKASPKPEFNGTRRSYRIFDGDREVFDVFVENNSIPLAPGTYQASDLERRFDQTYTSMTDLYVGGFDRRTVC